MPHYIAMLRGINVSGHKPIKMDALRASFESLGFSDVKTYVQSGNVVFKAAAVSESRLADKIAATIMADFGHAVSVLLRTPAELDQVWKQNPLANQSELEAAHLYVTFLSKPAPDGAAEILKKLGTAGEQIWVIGRECGRRRESG
jgi:uncharacterized protein (DUF1697 family)